MGRCPELGHRRRTRRHLNVSVSPRSAAPGTEIESTHFRSVLGMVPTGVAVITGRRGDGSPVGMTVGTFASVSLDPPLVSFMAVRGSSTCAAVLAAGTFCANILGDEQEEACRVFAGRGQDKFVGIRWHPSPSGTPILDDVVAWVDCDVETVLEAGDHHIVVGRVRDLQQGTPSMPLVFLQGSYGRVALRSFAAWHEDLLQPLRLADLARPRLESLSASLARECILTAAVQQELVLLASAGTPSAAGLTRVGQRMPFLPPLGSLFVAWSGAPAEAAWCKRASDGALPSHDDELAALLARVRERGFTAGVGRSVHLDAERLLARSFSDERAAARASAREAWAVLLDGVDPLVLDQSPGNEVRSIAVPVFDTTGVVALSLGVHGLSPSLTLSDIHGLVEYLTSAASDISAVLAS